MNRKQAREELFKITFEMSFKKADELEEVLTDAVENKEIDDNYVLDTVRSLYIHLDEIDNQIAINAQDWKFERISKVSLSVMRIAVYELLYTDIPYQIVINEAVELTKKFDDEKASKFVNGILNKVSLGKRVK